MASSYPHPTSSAVTNQMRAQAGRARTRPELAVRSAVHRRGLRYRADASLPVDGLRRRRADLLFARQRVAVFVDGCFWHSCPEHGTRPNSNKDYWTAKLERNRCRDNETTLALEAAGWTVIRTWEHDEPEAVAEGVEGAVKAAALNTQ